jgi:trehalose-6-phosphatase
MFALSSVVLAFDYDGTLVPIAAQPSAAPAPRCFPLCGLE